MIIYDFIEQRFDQLADNSHLDAQYMVDDLWNDNFLKFRRNDPMVNDICKELFYALDDIPF